MELFKNKYLRCFGQAYFLLFLLLGCSENINKSPQNFSLVQGSTIPSEKALKITIYRKFSFQGSLKKIPIYCDGNLVTNMPVKKSLVLTLEPGAYQFHTGKETAQIKVTGEAEQNFFMEIYLHFSWWSSKFKLRLVENKKGMEESDAYSRIELTYHNREDKPEMAKTTALLKESSSPIIQTNKRAGVKTESDSRTPKNKMITETSFEMEEPDFGKWSIFAPIFYSVIKKINTFTGDIVFSVILTAMLFFMYISIFDFNYRRNLLNFQRQVQIEKILRGGISIQDTLRIRQLTGAYRGPLGSVFWFFFYGMSIISGYSLFNSATVFKDVDTIFWLSDLSKRDPRFILPAIAAVIMVLKWRPFNPVNVFSILFAVIVINFLPAGFIIAILIFMLLSYLQYLYDNWLTNRTFFRSIIPQVAAFALVFFVCVNFVSPIKQTQTNPLITEHTSNSAGTPIPVNEGKVKELLQAEQKGGDLASVQEYISQGKWEKAVEEIDALIKVANVDLSELKKSKAEVLYHIALAARSRGDRHKAYQFLSEILILDPGNVESKKHLAKIYAEVGKENLKHICLRTGNTVFHPVKRYVKKGDIIPLYNNRFVEKENWIAIQGSSNSIAWIYKPLVKKIIHGVGNLKQVKVVNKRTKDETFTLLDHCVELDPDQKIRIFRLKYLNYIILGVILIIAGSCLIYIIK